MSGLPASGKSTLGREIAKALRLPMLDKDEMLEALFESQGIGDTDWRRRLSRLADDGLIGEATNLTAAVVTSWWHHPESGEASGTPIEWLSSLQGEIIEIYCACSPPIAASRFLGRTRHAGHIDSQYAYSSLLASFQAQSALGPLRVGRTVEVNTETWPCVSRLLAELGINPSENPSNASPAP